MKNLVLLSFILIACSFSLHAQYVNNLMAGTFNQADSCNTYQHTQNTTVSITRAQYSTTDVVINGFSSSIPTNDVTVTIDSFDNTLTIPFQSFGMVNITGSGTYTANYNHLTVYAVEDYGSGANSCVEIYQRQGTTSGIAMVDGSFQFSLYPSPAVNRLSVISSQLREGTIRVCNILGQTLITQPVIAAYNHTDIDVSHLAPGVYLLAVQTNERTEVRKFVKQ